ncbi:MAG TPA: hypothetical protein VGL93_03535 [Streptosporangiaceae bacterium]|jgi:hypothetical protein
MRVARGAGYAFGGALMLFGLLGLLSDAGDDHPIGWALWFAGGVLVHDLVIAPVVVAAGWALRRVARPVRAGLLVSVLVVAGVAPVVLALGRKPDNPSILPLPYGRNLVLVLAVVWLGAGAVWAVRRVRQRRGVR